MHRFIATKDVEDNTIVGGVPAKVVWKRENLPTKINEVL